MEHISIFNYEAFYLDFLEGNLNEEETALFLAFMEAHPELRIEDEAMLAIQNEFVSLDQSFKENLKQILYNETVISFNNVEQFLIAQLEGLLSETKNTELNVFLVQYPALLQLQHVYESTKLNPDLSVVYTQKSSLKQARRVALWPILSFAAAASIALVLYVQYPSTDFGRKAESMGKIHRLQGANKSMKDKKRVIVVSSSTETELIAGEHPIKESLVQTPLKSSYTTPEVNHLAMKKLMEISVDETENEIENQPIVYAINSSKHSDVVSNNSFQDMNNPIKPITNRLSYVVKQEVDFRMAKATEKTPGGFYLKIGKLEISHRKN